MTTAARIEQQLQNVFTPTSLKVIDQSALHANHPEAQQSGGGHFNVEIVSSQFADKTMLQCHQMVYAALSELMPQIHALSIKTKAP